ncbi:hypothetical protein OU994_17565 [Pseudoduganella sp. SL102]|uniref:hypothetical protein n=1 Tax=Pseudoduganella sp. SL102 TaxID=2995154 RepID=UPI00248C9472|nr:hypothetical protein [Pseudoduganella sp. SL102]WBS00131.1 hypothetical protein OU994_17565 [Pseudoduganella sp. SL102]
MNWREFTALTEEMAAGSVAENAAAIHRALGKRALGHTAACWLRFASTCSSTPANLADLPRATAPSPWLPPTP